MIIFPTFDNGEGYEIEPVRFFIYTSVYAPNNKLWMDLDVIFMIIRKWVEDIVDFQNTDQGNMASRECQIIDTLISSQSS